MHFPVSSACTAYMVVPISAQDQEFGSWDPGSHSTQQVKEHVLSLIISTTGAVTNRLCWPTISFTVRDSLHLKKLSLSTLLPHTLLHQQCLCCFQTSRACTWCPCPYICAKLGSAVNSLRHFLCYSNTKKMTHRHWEWYCWLKTHWNFLRGLSAVFLQACYKTGV